MSVWPLIGVVSVAWVLWAIVGAVAVEADRRQKKVSADAGYSVFPVIPLCPVLFVLLARWVDGFAPRWGSWVVGGLHAVLIVAALVSVVYEWRRVRSAGGGS